MYLPVIGGLYIYIYIYICNDHIITALYVNKLYNQHKVVGELANTLNMQNMLKVTL